MINKQKTNQNYQPLTHLSRHRCVLWGTTPLAGQDKASFIVPRVTSSTVVEDNDRGVHMQETPFLPVGHAFGEEGKEGGRKGE